MELFFLFLLILGFVLAPGALVVVDRRMVRGWLRTFAMVAIFFLGIASIWAAKSQEVRGVAYQFHLDTAPRLGSDGLERPKRPMGRRSLTADGADERG